MVAGVRISVVRFTATTIGGAFSGLVGASLVLAQVGTFTFQAMDLDIPYQFFLMLLYLLTILALAGVVGRVTAPQVLGR